MTLISFMLDVISLVLPAFAGTLQAAYSHLWAPDRKYLEYEIDKSNKAAENDQTALAVQLTARGVRNTHSTTAHLFVDDRTEILSCVLVPIQPHGMHARRFTAEVDPHDRRQAKIQIPLMYPGESVTLQMRCSGDVSHCWIETPGDPSMAKPVDATASVKRKGTLQSFAVLALWGVSAYLIWEGGLLKWVGWGLVIAGFGITSVKNLGPIAVFSAWGFGVYFVVTGEIPTLIAWGLVALGFVLVILLPQSEETQVRQAARRRLNERGPGGS